MSANPEKKKKKKKGEKPPVEEPPPENLTEEQKEFRDLQMQLDEGTQEVGITCSHFCHNSIFLP